MLRTALVFDATIPTFRGTGAWRVASCWERQLQSAPPIDVMVLNGRKELVMDVPRPLRRGAYVNPTKLLREVFEQRRSECVS